MANKNKNDQNEERNLVTLTDSDTNEDIDFEVIATVEMNGKEYWALIELDKESTEYHILITYLKGEDRYFQTVDDDDELDQVEDYFNDLFFGVEDYDN